MDLHFDRQNVEKMLFFLWDLVFLIFSLALTHYFRNVQHFLFKPAPKLQ